MDSIQAGLRAHGVLSIVDYPNFEKAEAPDMETFSKALNAGQYPLSVLAVNARAAGLYRKGTYGNTMTTNPVITSYSIHYTKLYDARALQSSAGPEGYPDMTLPRGYYLRAKFTRQILDYHP